MKYYFDTCVWISYFDENEFYHKEAIKWFKKVENETLIVSQAIAFEISNSRPEYLPNFLKYSEENKSVILIKVLEEDKTEAYSLSKTTEFDYGDLLHLLIAKKHNLIPVTSDIHHWPKITRLFEVYNLKYITEFFL